MTPAVQTVRSAAISSPFRVCTPSARDPRDLLPGVDLDAERLELRASVAVCSRSGSAGSTLGAASISRISTSRVGIEAAQAVADQLARGVAQLGGELDPGRAGADDREAQAPAAARAVASAWPCRKRPRIWRWMRSASAGLSRYRQCSSTPGTPKSLSTLPTAITSSVVAEPPPGHQLGAARVADRVEHDLAPRPIEAAHPAELEAEADGSRACAK